MLCELTADELNWNYVLSRSCSTATCWTEMKFLSSRSLLLEVPCREWDLGGSCTVEVQENTCQHAGQVRTTAQARYPQNRHARTAYACARCWNVSAVSVHARYVLRYRSRARCPHARYVLRTAPARCLPDRRSRVAGSYSSRQMWRAGLQDQIGTRHADGWKTQLSSV